MHNYAHKVISKQLCNCVLSLTSTSSPVLSRKGITIIHWSLTQILNEKQVYNYKVGCNRVKQNKVELYIQLQFTPSSSQSKYCYIWVEEESQNSLNLSLILRLSVNFSTPSSCSIPCISLWVVMNDRISPSILFSSKVLAYLSNFRCLRKFLTSETEWLKNKGNSLSLNYHTK